MARASRWSPARRKDDGVRTRGARPRLGKPKSAAYSPKPNKTTRDIPCGTKTPRPTWAPLRPPRPSVGGSMRRRCVAVCDRPPGWWCWEMVDLGSGGLPRCIFPGPSKSWIYHAREHLANLGKCIYGPTCREAKQWAAARSEQLDQGDVEAVITSMKR